MQGAACRVGGAAARAARRSPVRGRRLAAWRDRRGERAEMARQERRARGGVLEDRAPSALHSVCSFTPGIAASSCRARRQLRRRRCLHLIDLLPASMWVELPGELVKLIAQQKSVRWWTMRRKAWYCRPRGSLGQARAVLQKVPRETLVPLLAAAWQDSPEIARGACTSACAPIWIEHAVEDVGEIIERDRTVYPPYRAMAYNGGNHPLAIHGREISSTSASTSTTSSRPTRGNCAVAISSSTTATAMTA